MKMRKMSERELTELRKMARRDKTQMLGHLISCYETIFNNACDENSDVLEFKPEIKEAMELFEKQKKGN